jgi:hypothetical protein
MERISEETEDGDDNRHACNGSRRKALRQGRSPEPSPAWRPKLSAVKMMRCDRAEAVMNLLGRDASKEDCLREAEEQTHRFCDELVTTYACDRPEKERLSIDEVARFLLSSGS